MPEKKHKGVGCSILKLFCLLAPALFAAFSAAQDVVSVQDLYKIEGLPRMRPVVKVGSFSSYDRTGGNDDGFSGKYSFIRRENDALVIAELKGPGVITRIWTATPNDSPLEFFFDGEKSPRLVAPFRQLFEGHRAPFLAPIAASGGGGFYSYLPLPFQRSCKILLRGPKMQFFQINYAIYEPSVRIASFDPADQSIETAISKVDDVWSSGRIPISLEGAQRHQDEHVLEAGKSATIFESASGGRVVAIRLRPASAFSGSDRRILLKATWDGDPNPAIIAPIGDFFGYSFGDPSAHSLLVGSENDTAYAYFPMPFDKSAKIEVVSEKQSGPPIHFVSDVFSSAQARQIGEGRFYALWHRENPVAQGSPFTFIDVQGNGHLVGVILQAQGIEPGQTLFFEGDDEATLDGDLSIHGTGSEDFFNGGWYDVPGRWNGRLSLPLSGALDYQESMGRTGGYRLMLTDAYVFHKSLKLTIEHGGEGNQVPADYTAVSFLYLDRPPLPAPILPDAASRAVTQPKRLVYVPGWNEPIFAFSFENMSLRKQEIKIEGKNVRVLSIEAKGEEMFGPHYIAFTLPAPSAGDYEVAVEALRGPMQGTIQLMSNNRAVGKPASFTAGSLTRGDAVDLGTVPFRTGENQIFLRLRSNDGGSSPFRVDLVRIVCTRQ